MNNFKTNIYDCKKEEFVPALVRFNLVPEEIIEIEVQWKQVRSQIASDIESQGKDPNQYFQHGFWNWAKKSQWANLLSYYLISIETEKDNKTQGLMLVELASHYASLPPDRNKPLVYVSFLETAPWNLKYYNEGPTYKIVGPRLIQTAIQLSINEEFGGRIGLYSLPQAESFYKKIGMTPVDNPNEKLRWFEFTKEQAMKFLEGSI